MSLLPPVTCWEPCKEVSNGLHGARLLWLSPKGDYSTVRAVIPNTGSSRPASSGKKMKRDKPAAENPSPPSSPHPQLSALPPTRAKPLLAPSHLGNGCLPTPCAAFPCGSPLPLRVPPSPAHRRPSALIPAPPPVAPGPSRIPETGSLGIYTLAAELRHAGERGRAFCRRPCPGWVKDCSFPG